LTLALPDPMTELVTEQTHKSRHEFVDGFDDSILVVPRERVVKGKPHETVTSMFCYRALTNAATEVLSDWGSVQWLIVENAGDIPTPHVVNEPTALFGGRKTHVVDVADVLTAFGIHWQLDAVMMSPCSEL